MSATLAQGQTGQQEALERRLNSLQQQNVQQMEQLRNSLNEGMKALQEENARKLDEIRHTVDEQLQDALQKRVTESFQAVNAQLEQVYKGLGEMQTLAADVGGLKQVLSGVKTRGILGEIQLGAILEEILAPEQFDTNVATIPGSTQRVEYAVKLPGADGGTVWLPIDSKVPGGYLRPLAGCAGGRETLPLRPTPAMRWKWCCAARQRISGKNMWSRPIPPHSASCSCPLRGCMPRW